MCQGNTDIVRHDSPCLCIGDRPCVCRLRLGVVGSYVGSWVGLSSAAGVRKSVILLDEVALLVVLCEFGIFVNDRG